MERFGGPLLVPRVIATDAHQRVRQVRDDGDDDELFVCLMSEIDE